MFRQMFFLQWKWSRVSVLLMALIALAVPIWSVSGDQSATITSTPPLLERMAAAGNAYGLLAAAAGFLLAMHAWRTDHSKRHVYALTLPLPRWRYTAYRYAGGALLGCALAAVLWLSAMMAARITDIPPGLHAYPTGLALRFAFALLVCFAFFFALWSATARAAYYVAGAGVLLGVVLALFAYRDSTLAADAVRATWRALGMNELFGGRWFLLDV
jgi:hypothetical protein